MAKGFWLFGQKQEAMEIQLLKNLSAGFALPALIVKSSCGASGESLV
jgi:hypothetical protein